MAKAQQKKRAPRITFANFDNRAGFYTETIEEIKATKDLLDLDREAFIRFLKRHGIIRDGAEKSKAYSGREFEALVTFGRSVVIDAELVEKLREAMKSEGLEDMFDEIFQSKTTYALLPAAEEWSGQLPKRLQRLFKKAQSSKPKTPQLTVRQLKKEQEAAAS